MGCLSDSLPRGGWTSVCCLCLSHMDIVSRDTKSWLNLTSLSWIKISYLVIDSSGSVTVSEKERTPSRSLFYLSSTFPDLHISGGKTPRLRGKTHLLGVVRGRAIPEVVSSSSVISVMRRQTF